MDNIKFPVQIVTKRIAVHSLVVFYPVIIEGTMPFAIQKMNSMILNSVNKLIKDQGFFDEPQTTQVNGYYEIKTNERGVLSLSLTNYTYHYHAAHGMTIIQSLTFDIASGKNYELHELFKPDSNYIKRLSQIVERQIKERGIVLIEKFKEVRPNQDYYIADKALVIYYQLYEFTPYVFGFPMFPISVYEIQDIVKEDSPLGVMLVNG